MKITEQEKTDVQNGIVRTYVESFLVESNEGKGMIASGVALPLNKRSRNGVAYIAESVKEVISSMIGVPVLFNHNPDVIVGHIKNAYEQDGKVMYEMDIDESDPLAKKVKRKDLSKVSIQVMYDDEKSYYHQESDTTFAWVSEFLEMSLVSIPGFNDTSIVLHEKFNNKENRPTQTESENKTETDDSAEINTNGDTMTETKEKTKQEDVQSPDEHVTVMEDLTQKLEQTVETVNSFGERLSKIETKLEAMDDKSDDKEEEEADEEKENEKKESYTRKSKLNGTTNTEEEQVLSTSAFKETIKGC